MKQLIISVILAVLLVGCGEKPNFSINKDDTPETYANNPVFIKVEQHFTPATDEGKNTIVYQFIGGPVSFYDIKTSDLSVLGGSIYIISNPNMKSTYLIIKGEESFDKLADRLIKSKNLICKRVETGNDKVFQCADQKKPDTRLTIYYNSLSDIVSVTQVQY
ncbi:hypothetical protein DM558_02970 [Entomomonas moraniae]|uniref:Uncharacterized protein n=1 Tax=Entomomonas moraniae TaxID=2213226 RepID=A0A3Q9JHQ1_9GAMM|nr:hypothetical protein [Entomomonas moraniae]AZS49805.1 hypothetical protein DM558_02970 [Entomomonas moraniae]